MYILFILSIISGFVLFLVTKNNFNSENPNLEKQKLFKTINTVGLIVLLVLLLYKFSMFLRFFIVTGYDFYLPQQSRDIIEYLFAIVSAIMYIKSIKLSIKGKPKEKKESQNNSKYYISFKAITIIVCLLSTALDFVTFGILTNWNFSPEASLIIIPFCLAFSVLYTYLYFLPYLIAVRKQHKQKRAIYILNIFTSWTIIVWVVALVWANTETKETVIINQASSSVASSDEILNYKKLLDDGVITQEEFEAKKKQILGL